MSHPNDSVRPDMVGEEVADRRAVRANERKLGRDGEAKKSPARYGLRVFGAKGGGYGAWSEEVVRGRGEDAMLDETHLQACHVVLTRHATPSTSHDAQ